MLIFWYIIYFNLFYINSLVNNYKENKLGHEPHANCETGQIAHDNTHYVVIISINRYFTL